MKINTDASLDLVIPISYGSTEVIETGKWGFQKPHTVLMKAPCQEACPAGVNIPQFLYLTQEKRYDEALFTILRENPLPGVCGRVCFHPCEAHCNRAQYDEAVSIHAMERFVSDVTANQIQDIQVLSKRDSKKVAVVGAGPAGLSCSYFLSLLGYPVTLFEEKREPGGVMRWGIPEYRLPKSVLRKEIQRILTLPIEMRTGVRVGRDIPFDALDEFDAVFLSPGAGRNAPLLMKGGHPKRVWEGGAFLERINSKEKINLGKETMVIGGGNTAMDVARSALRLGSKVTIAYRRTKSEMPAIQDEIMEAEEEGVRFEFLVQPVRIHLTPKGRSAVTLQRMKLGSPDSSNRPRAVPIRGNFLTLETDSLISAVGELVDLSWIPEQLVQEGLIDTVNIPKFFAGGDAVFQPRTIVTAIASGKKAAISIDLFLRGEDSQEKFSRVSIGNKGSLSMEGYVQGREDEKWPEKKEVVSYQQINTLYFEPSQRVRMRKRHRNKALKGFSEVNLGYNIKEALFSASRCFSCGTCNYCYHCYFFCPEGVISIDPVDRSRVIDYLHCKGCGTCAKSCPRNVVVMKEVV